MTERIRILRRWAAFPKAAVGDIVEATDEQLIAGICKDGDLYERAGPDEPMGSPPDVESDVEDEGRREALAELLKEAGVKFGHRAGLARLEALAAEHGIDVGDPATLPEDDMEAGAEEDAA